MSDESNAGFVVGDVVRVSNIVGPRMVVVDVGKDEDGFPEVQCGWFSRRNEFMTEYFEPQLLSRASRWIYADE